MKHICAKVRDKHICSTYKFQQQLLRQIYQTNKYQTYINQNKIVIKLKSQYSKSIQISS